MKMKKAIAGALASVVAVSAMATMAVSAKEETYSLKSQVWAANWAGDFEVNTSTALPVVNVADPAAGLSTAEIAAAVDTQVAGTIILTFDQPIAELKGKITYAEHVVGGTENAEVKTTKEIVFVDTPDDNKATWAITVKTNSQAVSAGEVYVPTEAVVRNIQFTAKTGEITSTGVKPTAGTIQIDSVSALGGSDLQAAFDTLTDEIPGADVVQLKGAVVKKDVYPYDIKGATKVTDLEKDYDLDNDGSTADDFGAGYADIQLPVNFRKNANLFFTDAVNGVLTFEFELVPVDAADDGLTGPQTPGSWDIPLLSTTVTTKDIGLALNWNVTSNLVEAKDIVDNKVSFSWDELSKYIAGDGNGTVTDWAIKISSAFNDKYKNIYIKSITFTKDDASAATEPSAPDASSSTGSTDVPNPGTGNAPIALAVIPVALAAAAIVASKKRA